MRLAVVIPAYNEAATVRQVIAKLPARLPRVSDLAVVVVDDHSSDATAEEARRAGAHVVSHALNLGQGGAVLTGVTYAERLGAETVITLDGDGQHDASEIKQLLLAQRREQADLVIGSRFLSKTIKNMPTLKKVGNRGFSVVTYLLSGEMLTDTQSGFRLFGERMIDVLLATELVGYEFCSETIMLAGRHNLAIAEVPISTIYFDGRAGQHPLNGVNILLRLIARKLTG